MGQILLEKGKEDLFNIIDGYDVICFDLFDVLLGIKILNEEDVILLAAAKAEKEKIEVIQFAETRKKYVGRAMSMKEIYKNLKETLKIPVKTCEELYQIELECWENLIFGRKDVIESFQYAEEKGKTVFIYKDYFFDESFIRNILERLQILNRKNLIILHKEANCLNDNDGSRKLWITSKRENQQCDGDVLYVKSSITLFKESPYAIIIDMTNNVNERLMVARLAARAFENPFNYNGQSEKPIVNTVENFMYLFVAPFVSGFMIWLLEQVCNEQYDKILFSARDGYIIRNLYREAVQQLKLESAPKDLYLQISRTLCVAATVFSDDEIINYAKVRYALEPEKMLQRRFGLKQEDILPYDKSKYKNVVEYALAHKDKIIIRSAEIRNNYIKYINELEIKIGEKYAFFDFVSSGTCQLLLNKVINLDVEGIYACRYFPFQGITNYTSVDEKNKLPIKAYIVNQSISEKESYFFSNYNFLETVFTSPYPSVASMDTDGPVFDEEKRTEDDLLNIKKAHASIREYFEEFLDNYVEGETISFILIDKIFSLKDSDYTDEGCAFLDNCELIEDFGQGRIKLKRK